MAKIFTSDNLFEVAITGGNAKDRVSFSVTPVAAAAVRPSRDFSLEYWRKELQNLYDNVHLDYIFPFTAVYNRNTTAFNLIKLGVITDLEYNPLSFIDNSSAEITAVFSRKSTITFSTNPVNVGQKNFSLETKTKGGKLLGLSGRLKTSDPLESPEINMRIQIIETPIEAVATHSFAPIPNGASMPLTVSEAINMCVGSINYAAKGAFNVNSVLLATYAASESPAGCVIHDATLRIRGQRTYRGTNNEESFIVISDGFDITTTYFLPTTSGSVLTGAVNERTYPQTNFLNIFNFDTIMPKWNYGTMLNMIMTGGGA